MLAQPTARGASGAHIPQLAERIARAAKATDRSAPMATNGHGANVHAAAVPESTEMMSQGIRIWPRGLAGSPTHLTDGARLAPATPSRQETRPLPWNRQRALRYQWGPRASWALATLHVGMWAARTAGTRGRPIPGPRACWTLRQGRPPPGRASSPEAHARALQSCSSR